MDLSLLLKSIIKAKSYVQPVAGISLLEWEWRNYLGAKVCEISSQIWNLNSTNFTILGPSLLLAQPLLD